jgi:RIO-like serine/threonine protein kinase
VRRIAEGSRLPFSRRVARLLLERERRALARLSGTGGVPELVEERDLGARRSAGSAAPALLRTHLEGRPLGQASELAADYFLLLAALVDRIHARGVCHNDLHKEANLLVAPDGRPALIDFQLASVHPRGGRRFAGRAREDLRHVAKHARRYFRGAGRPPGEPDPGAVPRRSLWAWLWRRLAKPLYQGIVPRRLRDRADRPRPRSGPWPRWTAPAGERARRD